MVIISSLAFVENVTNSITFFVNSKPIFTAVNGLSYVL